MSERFFSRQHELREALAFAQEPRSGALIIEGSRGSGKSVFLAEVGRYLAIPATRVAASGAEMHTPYSGLSLLVASHGIPSVMIPREASDTGPEHTQACALLLLDALRASPGLPQALLIDDIDCFDETSQQVLAYLCRRLVGTGLIVLCSAGPISDRSPFSGIAKLSLTRFPEHQLTELAAATAPAAADPSVLKVVAESADGNPAAALDIVHEMRPEQLRGTEPLCLPFRPSDPESEILLGSVSALSAPARRVLGWLSTAPFVQLAALTFADPHAQSVLPELINAGVISHMANGLSIRRPRLRAALFWSLAPEEKAEIGRALELASPEMLRTWHASFSEFSPAAAPGLRRGALELVREGKTFAAVEFAERANALDNPSADNAAAIVDLADAFFQRGEIEHARHYCGQVLGSSLDGALTLRVSALQLACEFFLSQRVDAWHAERAISEHAVEHPVAAAHVQLLLAALTAGRWEPEPAREMLAVADRMPGTHAPENTALSRAIHALIDTLTTGLPPAEAHVPTALFDPTGWGPLTDLLFAEAHWLAEEYDHARHLLDGVVAGATDAHRLWPAVARLHSVELERRAGNTGAALSSMAQLIKSPMPEVLRHTLALNTAWFRQEISHGEIREEWSRAMHLFNSGRRNPRVNGLVDSLRGAYALRSGSPDEALPSLSRCRESAEDLKNPQLLRYDANLVEALLATGDRPGAVRAYQEFTERAALVPSRWAELMLRRCEALLLEGEASLAAFSRTLQLFRADEMRFERACTQAVFSERLGALGFSEQAAHLLRAAQHGFRDIGLPKWADALKGAQGSEPDTGTVSPLDQLTLSQRQVVQHVLAGKKNREIAQALFVSTRTVEVRLTSVYQQLGVSSRYELIAKLTPTTPEPPR